MDDNEITRYITLMMMKGIIIQEPNGQVSLNNDVRNEIYFMRNMMMHNSSSSLIRDKAIGHAMIHGGIYTTGVTNHALVITTAERIWNKEKRIPYRDLYMCSMIAARMFWLDNFNEAWYCPGCASEKKALPWLDMGGMKKTPSITKRKRGWTSKRNGRNKRKAIRRRRRK